MITTPLYIAMGAIAGALSRYAVVSVIAYSAYPLGTLCVNVLGAFLLGVCVEAFALTAHGNMHFQACVVVGFLGSFTTFSAYSLELVLMLKRQAYLSAISYMMLSTGLAMGALVLGMRVVSVKQ